MKGSRPMTKKMTKKAAGMKAAGTSEEQTPPQRAGRGGSRGGGRPRLGEPRTVKLAEPLWEFCLAQPGGAGPFLRRLIEQAMTEAPESQS